MQYYNRRERRKLAKQLGLNRTKLTTEQKQEQAHRAIQAGQQIHALVVTEAENESRKQQSELEAKQLQSFIEAFGEEVGRQKWANNIRISKEKRKNKNK
jgi:hypothetical protein